MGLLRETGEEAMSQGVATDVISQIIQFIRKGLLVGPHNHSVAQGGPIVTDLPITVTNPLQPAIVTGSQVLNQNLNADLWRGRRIYNVASAILLPAPSTSILNRGDMAWDGKFFYIWAGTAWLPQGTINFDVNGGLVGSEQGLNLIQGSNVTVTGADNPGSNRVDVTIAATGGGGTPHPLMDGSQNSDTIAYSPTAGDLITSSGNLWEGLPAGTNGYVLTMQAGIPSWQPAGAATQPGFLKYLIAVGT